MALLGNLTALGVLASVAGGAFAGIMPATESSPVETAADSAGETPEIYLELELIAVPMIIDKRIEGYLLSRYLVRANEEAAARFGENLQGYLGDIIYRHLMTNAALLDTQNTYKIFGSTEDGLKQKINSELGVNLVESITTAQFDIMENDAVLIDTSITE